MARTDDRVAPAGDSPKGPGRAAHFGRFGRAVARRPGLALALAGVLVAAAAVLGARVRLDPDLLAVVSKDDPAVRTFLETSELFGNLDRLLVVLHLPAAEGGGSGGGSAAQGPGREPYLDLASRVAASLQDLPEVAEVEYRLSDLGKTSEELVPWAALLVAPRDIGRLAEKLSARGLAEATAVTRRRLRSPYALVSRERLKRDPFDLLPLVTGRFDLDELGGGRIDPESGFLLSPDGRILLLQVRATKPAHDVDFARRLVRAVRGVLEAQTAAVRSELAPELRDAFDPRPALAGGYALAAGDVRQVGLDLARNTIFALVAVGVLFLLAFGRPVAFVLAVVPLAAGLALTAGLAELTVGRVSSLTASVAALLVGLGVDFSIVLLERYGEERRRGHSPETAAGTMLGSTGRGVTVGALTTAATFFCFLIASFRGLFELGWLAGSGILLCLAATFVLLPALLAARDRRGGRGPRGAGLRMRSFGSPALVAWCRRHPPLTGLAWLAVLGVAALGLPRLSFAGDLGALRSADHAVIRTQREVAEAFGVSSRRMLLRVDGPDLETVLARARRLRERLQPLLDDGTLERVLSLPDLVPSRADQEEVLAALAAGRAGAFSPERVTRDARRALEGAGLAPAAFAGALSDLARALDPPGLIDFERLSQGPLGPWLGRFLARRGARRGAQGGARQGGQGAGGWSTALYVAAPPGRRASRPPPLFDRIERIAASAGAIPVGLETLSEAMRRQAWRDLERIAPLALLAVWCLLVLDFGSLRLASLALVPVPPGLLILLGLAGALGFPLSLMNLFVVVLVLGIGVDYGVHMVHRQREAETNGTSAGGLDAALGETSKAVLLAGLTTALGFGSLALSGFAGLRSVGWLSAFGALGCALAALTLVPALLRAAGARTPR